MAILSKLLSQDMQMALAERNIAKEREEMANMKEFDIGFTPPTVEEEWETACQKVADLTDSWPWLGPVINDERLTWRQIMELVAENI